MQQRSTEVDTQYHNLYASELEKWKSQFLLDHENEEEAKTKAAVQRALNGSRSTIKGRSAEQLIPFFPQFASKYVAADARFLGSPIDFIVFKNLHTLSKDSEEPQKPIEIVFVEVKVDRSRMTDTERAVEAAVKGLKVTYDFLRIPVDTKGDLPSFNGETPNNGGANTKEKIQLCSRCQFGLKCDCKNCPSCPNKFTLESDAQTQ